MFCQQYLSCREFRLVQTLLTSGIHRGLLYASGCLTMVISVERCVCVALPIKAATLIATRTMVVIIVSIVVSLQLLCIVYPFRYDVVSSFDESM